MHRLRSAARARAAGVLLSVLLAAPATAQQGPRIGYVDMQRLLDSAPQVIDARARLATEFRERDAQLKTDERRLAELENTLRTSAVAAENQNLLAQADALRRSVERERRRLREELNSRRQQEEERVLPIISETVAEYAREEGYDLVLQMPVIYVSGRIDITDRVLDRLRRSADEASP